jgi:hypothetical protein
MLIKASNIDFRQGINKTLSKIVIIIIEECVEIITCKREIIFSFFMGK